MRGTYPRRWLIGACLAALLLLTPRAAEVFGLLRDRRAAAAAYSEGSRLQLDREFAQAADAYRTAIAIYPTAYEVYFDLAQVEIAQGHFEDAIWAYRQLLQTYPFSYTASLDREVGFVELRVGSLEQARRDLRQAVTLDPTDWLAYHYLANVHRRLGDAQAARAAWERVLILQPEFTPARAQLDRLNADPR